MGSSDTTARVLIVTSSAAKMRALMGPMNDWRQEEHESGWIYERTLMQTLVCTWEIIAIEAASGDEIKHALQVFEPRLAISIDTAAGIDSMSIGDVVVANRVQTVGGFSRAVSFALLQKIRADARG